MNSKRTVGVGAGVQNPPHLGEQMGPRYSRHAQQRVQQRGIDEEVVAILLEHGRRRHYKGAIRCYMDKRSRARLESAMDGETYRRVIDRLNSYVVLSSDGTQILTVGQRLKRWKGV